MTYHHFCGGSESQIDHIMTLNQQQDVITKVQVESLNPSNTSPHDAVIATLDACLSPKPKPKYSSATTIPQKHNWTKVDLEKYSQLTEERLACLISTGGLDLPNDALVTRVNDILTTSAADSGAKSAKRSRKKKREVQWSHVMKPLVKRLKEKIWLWKQTGKDPKSELIPQIKKAKKELRSVQRKGAASQRIAQLSECMAAHEGDKLLFFKLIKKQREPQRTGLATIDFGKDTSQIEGWTDYFEDLATPSNNPNYDNEYKTSRELKFHLLAAQQERENATPITITESQVKKHASKLKNNKAADLYGITAEHIKLASNNVMTAITTITNNALTSKSLPDQFRVGKVVPVLKKNKPATDPNGHRRITINSIISKIVEKEIVTRSKEAMTTSQHRLQFGFTEHCSPSHCAFIISEAITEARDTRQQLFITLMDARKAFDVVWQESALVSLHEQGTTGAQWSMYVDLYKSVTSRILVNGELSREIQEKIGIKQGAESSTGVFNSKSNTTLSQIASQPDSFHIGSIPVGVPTVADDMCLLSTSRIGAQTLLYIAQNDANRERYDFSTTKTKTILCNSSLTPEEAQLAMPLQLNNNTLAYVNAETHLGLERSTKGCASTTISARVQSGRRVAYALMGAGLHGLNGVSPEVSMSMIDSYVMPTVMYGLDAMELSASDYRELHTFQRRLLRQIQHLPKATAVPALYLLTGSLPLEAHHHKSVLSLFGRMVSRNGSLEREIVLRQLGMKDLQSGSWVSLVRRLLLQYELPSAFDLASDPPRKAKWKDSIKRAIYHHWEEKLKTEAANKSSLTLLNLEACTPGKVHPVWTCGSDPFQVHMACTKARLLTQRYALGSSHCAGRHKSQSCPLCHGPPETLDHFLLNCPETRSVRKPYLKKLDRILCEFYFQPRNSLDVTQAIVDCTALSWIPEDVRDELEKVSRRLTFQLHNHRAVQLGLGSRFSNARLMLGCDKHG